MISKASSTTALSTRRLSRRSSYADPRWRLVFSIELTESSPLEPCFSHESSDPQSACFFGRRLGGGDPVLRAIFTVAYTYNNSAFYRKIKPLTLSAFKRWILTSARGAFSIMHIELNTDLSLARIESRYLFFLWPSTYCASLSGLKRRTQVGLP